MRINPQTQKLVNHFLAGILASLAALLVTGCGPDSFKVGPIDEPQEEPGFFIVPPKVDILFAEDDTGSMAEALTTIQSQTPELLDALEKTGWDYHFATVPLTQNRPVNQILTSTFDSNYANFGQWTPPFPGAPSTLGIPSQFFRMVSNYTDFLEYSDLSFSTNASEPGLQNIVSHLNQPQSSSTGFLRSDAMLAVIVVSNGEDTSGATPCTRSDGLPDFCNPTPVSQFENSLTSLKASPQMVKFYSAIAYQPGYQGGNCSGAYSHVGFRYHQVALDLGGRSYDVCNTALSTILDDLGSHLHEIKLAFRTRFLAIGIEPEPSSIKVTKILPNGSKQVLPNSSTNGWTYVGLTTVYAIDSPVLMNQITGYIIELHGDAKLLGDETADIAFQALGSGNASQ